MNLYFWSNFSPYSIHSASVFLQVTGPHRWCKLIVFLGLHMRDLSAKHLMLKIFTGNILSFSNNAFVNSKNYA